MGKSNIKKMIELLKVIPSKKYYERLGKGEELGIYVKELLRLLNNEKKKILIGAEFVKRWEYLKKERRKITTMRTGDCIEYHIFMDVLDIKEKGKKRMFFL